MRAVDPMSFPADRGVVHETETQISRIDSDFEDSVTPQTSAEKIRSSRERQGMVCLVWLLHVTHESTDSARRMIGGA
jgi:hypothetical protein